MVHRAPIRTAPGATPGFRSKGSVPVVASLCVLLLFSACAGKKPARIAAVQTAAQTTAIPATSAPPANIVAALPSASTPISQAPRPPSPGRPKPVAGSTIGEVAAKLSTSFVVAEPAPGTLRITRGPAGAAQRPALFEEAIILGRIRSALQSESLDGPGSSASFKAGIATIRFGPHVESGPAAVAIAKVLALTGVLRVDAVFQPANAPLPPRL